MMVEVAPAELAAEGGGRRSVGLQPVLDLAR